MDDPSPQQLLGTEVLPVLISQASDLLQGQRYWQQFFLSGPEPQEDC